MTSLKKIAEQEIKNVYDWLISNKLTLNWEKTFFVIYRSKRKVIEDICELKINHNCIKRVNSITYLGMTIDEHLKWDKHVMNICSKLTRNFHLFYNLRNLLPNHLKRQLYYSLVHSRIQYGIEVYGNCAKIMITRIQTMQNKLLKVLFKRPFRTPTIDLHNEYKLLKVEDIYRLNLMKFVFNSVRKQSISQFHKYFKFQRTIHSHETRQQTLLYFERPRTAFGENSIKHTGATIWNSLDPSLHKSKSINTFKKCLKNALLSKYLRWLYLLPSSFLKYSWVISTLYSEHNLDTFLERAGFQLKKRDLIYKHYLHSGITITCLLFLQPG